MSTRILPTDKHGQVYRGPRTIAEAKEWINERYDSESTIPAEHRQTLDAIVASQCERLEAAGYTGVAAKVRAHYRIYRR